MDVGYTREMKKSSPRSGDNENDGENWDLEQFQNASTPRGGIRLTIFPSRAMAGNRVGAASRC